MKSDDGKKTNAESNILKKTSKNPISAYAANTARMAKPNRINPVQRFKNQFPAYASNQSDDGDEPKL